MKQQIIAYALQVIQLSHGAWSFHPKGKTKKFQEQLFKYLRKTGAISSNKAINYRTVPIDTQKISQAIEDNATACRFFSGEPKYLLIGRKMMEELIGQEPLFWVMDGFETNTRWGNMTVIMCPWIDGFAVLPEIKNVHGAD